MLKNGQVCGNFEEYMHNTEVSKKESYYSKDIFIYLFMYIYTHIFMCIFICRYVKQ